VLLVAMATSQFFEVSRLFVFVSPLSNLVLEGFVSLALLFPSKDLTWLSLSFA